VSLPTRQVHEQGDVNCCFSCALASAVEAGDVSVPPLAPLFHFHLAGGERVVNQGLTLAEARRTLLMSGICAHSEHAFPISPATVGRVPSDAARRDGLLHRPMDAAAGSLLWKPLPIFLTERSWKRCLSAGFPIVIGLRPNSAYLALDASQPTLQTTAGVGEVSHAAVVIGFRDTAAAFVVQDSRGVTFGVEGQWFLPYALCGSPFLDLAFALAPDDFD